MLGLQVNAPAYFILEVVIVLFQQFDGIGVAHAGKIAVGNQLQTLDQALIKELIEECQLVRAVIQQVADNILGHGLGGVHVGIQVSKCHFRLNHPELCGMAGIIALLCAEGRAKGVNLAQGHCHGLGFQLAGNRQVDRALEEVLAVIHLAVLGLGHIVQVQGSNLEHLACAFAVRTGKDGGVYIGKAVLVEELMQGISGLAAHTERSVKGVGAGAQVGQGAQVIHAHLVFLQRVIAAAGTQHRNGISVDLKRLLSVGGQHQGAGHFKAGVQAGFCNLGIVFQLVRLENDLHGLIAAAVCQRDKTDLFRIAHGFCPAADSNFAAIRRGSLIERCNFNSFHVFPLLKCKCRGCI